MSGDFGWCQGDGELYESLLNTARYYARNGAYDDAAQMAGVAHRVAVSIYKAIPPSSFYHHEWKRLARRAERSVKRYRDVVNAADQAGTSRAN